MESQRPGNFAIETVESNDKTLFDNDGREKRTEGRFGYMARLPLEMHIAQNKIPKYSRRWVGLILLSGACLIVSFLAASESIQGIITDLKTYRPFMS
ncbi:hypothetical protein TIFTF001_021546 [Ficus carica]|uniref:Uncharacterized protein n=1 Tax=Ficus carica TaxID=3494 RepID=A0AA88DAV2_FICCA|nr:hypothetical protein TIFTF001_021546 [Ficus carica]